MCSIKLTILTLVVSAAKTLAGTIVKSIITTNKILITFYVLFSLFLEWIGQGTAELTCCMNCPCRHGSCPRWCQGKEGEGKFLSTFIREHGTTSRGFPGGSVDRESACNAGDLHFIPGSGRSPGKENGNPLQHSYLENPWESDMT